MKILDGIILARTKSRAHRIRNWISVTISSLLFGVLLFGAIVIAGGLDSAARYQELGFNNHFLATAEITYMNSDNNEFYEQARKAVNEDLESRGIKITEEILDSDEYRWRIHELQFMEVEKMLLQFYTNFQQKTDSEYHPVAQYEFRELIDFSDRAKAIIGNADPLLSGAQDAVKKRNLVKFIQESTYTGLESPRFGLLDDELAKDMLANGEDMEIGSDGAIPIFMAYEAAAAFSSVEYDEKGLSTAEINQKYRELANDVTGKTVEYCYRNQTASNILGQALEYNYQLEKDDSDETPIVIENCAPIDDALLEKASPEIAATDKKEQLFPTAETESEAAPITKTLKFRIVGFAPFDSAHDQDAFLSGVNYWPNMSMNPPMIIPLSAASDNADLKQILNESGESELGTYFYDFANRADQKKFIGSGCQGWYCGSSGVPEARIQSFGNVSVALEHLIDSATATALIVAIVVIFVAMITTMAIIGKTVGESRREIAIFRTLGARRRDIGQIYAGFGLILTIRALLLALVIAIVAAVIVSYKFADSFNAELISATGAYTSNISSSLIGFDILWLLMISGALVLAALLGLILPIILGTRRKLIDHLREE